MLFFVSVGMLLDPAFLFANLGTVLTAVALVAVGKALIFAGITRAFGYRAEDALAVALGLFQVGEFAFVLARVGLADGALTADRYALVLAVALTTMLVTPFALRASEPITALVRRWRGSPGIERSDIPAHGLQGHIIICGYGRVGRYAASVLQRLQLPFVILERDYHRLDGIRAAGLPAIYGDASSPSVLEAAGVHDARLVLVVVSAAIDVELIVRQVRRMQPDLHIVARAAQLSQLDALRALGIHEAVQPEFEAGLELVRQSLLHFDMPPAEIERLSDEVRHEQYWSLRAEQPPDALPAEEPPPSAIVDVTWAQLPPGAPLAGRRLDDGGIQETGAVIVAIIQNGVALLRPTPDTLLHTGDQIAVLGTPAQRALFQTLLRSEAPPRVASPPQGEGL
jgi:CPA2 family monovalent cation:H+ antiporter-2